MSGVVRNRIMARSVVPALMIAHSAHAEEHYGGTKQRGAEKQQSTGRYTQRQRGNYRHNGSTNE